MIAVTLAEYPSLACLMETSSSLLDIPTAESIMFNMANNSLSNHVVMPYIYNFNDAGENFYHDHA